MTDESNKDSQASAGQAWEEVGQQFRLLGESLASAFKETWQSEETCQHLQKMQADLEVMVDEIGQATQKAAESEEMQKVKAEAKKAKEEIQPHLLAAFRKIRGELDQIISRMEQENSSDE